MRRPEPVEGSKPLETQVRDRVAVLTLNRPEARNALSRALTHALWDEVLAAGSDDAVDVVIITGADPAFCAGVDLKEVAGEVPMSDEPRGPGLGPERGPDGLYRFVPAIDKPLIAAVNGVCVTGGLELALQCDLIVASEQARFADTHARIGVMPGGGMTVGLLRSVGLRKALELSLTGDFLSAADALAAGLVNHVVPHADLLPAARALAATIAGNDRTAVRTLLAHYRSIGRMAEAQLAEGVLAETWAAGVSLVRERRADVTARGRSQSR